MNPQKTMSLIECVDLYVSERDLNNQYVDQLRHRCRNLHDFCGRPESVGDITLQQINDWLQAIQQTGLSKPTLRGYRMAAVIVINYAADLHLCEYPASRRIRRFKLPQPVVRAWTVEEMAALIKAARAEWKLYVRIGYETGLRRGDILRLTELPQEPMKPFAVVEHKTGRVVVKQVRPYTVVLWNALDGLEFNSTGRSWFDVARRLVKRAGLQGSLSKQLRRTHATHCPGGLQHADPGMLKHYEDRTQMPPIGMPPEL